MKKKETRLYKKPGSAYSYLERMGVATFLCLLDGLPKPTLARPRGEALLLFDPPSAAQHRRILRSESRATLVRFGNAQ